MRARSKTTTVQYHTAVSCAEPEVPYFRTPHGQYRFPSGARDYSVIMMGLDSTCSPSRWTNSDPITCEEGGSLTIKRPFQKQVLIPNSHRELCRAGDVSLVKMVPVNWPKLVRGFLQAAQRHAGPGGWCGCFNFTPDDEISLCGGFLSLSVEMHLFAPFYLVLPHLRWFSMRPPRSHPAIPPARDCSLATVDKTLKFLVYKIRGAACHHPPCPSPNDLRGKCKFIEFLKCCPCGRRFWPLIMPHMLKRCEMPISPASMAYSYSTCVRSPHGVRAEAEYRFLIQQIV